MRQHPCASTGKASGCCPGYVVDHVHALECGGADAPSSMQWQTTAAAKGKDRTERYSVDGQSQMGSGSGRNKKPNSACEHLSIKGSGHAC